MSESKWRSPEVSVVGIGTTGFGKFAERSVGSMANDAVTAALDDSGLQRAEVDGLFVHIGSPRGLDYDEMAQLLALDIRHASQTWSHGRFGSTVIANAVMALQCGLVDVALCVAAFKNSVFTRFGTPTAVGFFEGTREGGGPHFEAPFVGLSAPVAGAAMSTRRYLDRFGVDRERLGIVARSQRAAAAKNPLAVMQKPMEQSDYESARPIVDPLRLLDCSVPVDTAVAMILTRDDRAGTLRQPLVHVLAYEGLHAGPNEFIFGQPGLGVGQAEAFDYQPRADQTPVYQRAGITASDVQTLHCYDGFTTQVLWTLERFGFCPVGQAADWIDAAKIGLSGSLPINTSGGHLSEGHSNGWGQTLEIVRQLRGQAEDRQIPDLHVAQWATTLGDSIIYSNRKN